MDVVVVKLLHIGGRVSPTCLIKFQQAPRIPLVEMCPGSERKGIRVKRVRQGYPSM